MLLDFLRGNSTKSDVAVEANLNDAPSVKKFTIPEPDVSEMLFDQEVPFEEMIHDEENGVWLFDCPCGDQFVLAEYGHAYAPCPSCTLYIKVIYKK